MLDNNNDNLKGMEELITPQQLKNLVKRKLLKKNYVN